VVTVTIKPGGRVPYAPTKTVLKVVDRHRQFGLRAMDLQKLKSIGVTDALAPRTLASLVGLGFYDDKGQITQEFEALRLAPEADFKPQFGELMRQVYGPVLEILDPWTATRTEIEDAFRGFEPPGMRPRMVQLFEGLMAFAGLRPEGQRTGGVGGTKASASKPPGAQATKQSARTQSPKREREPEREPPPPLAAPPVRGSLDDMKRAYFDVLIEKAKQSDADDGLFDRIERLVGLEPADKSKDRDRKSAESRSADPAGPAIRGKG
jgi:hypothetical protein